MSAAATSPRKQAQPGNRVSSRQWFRIANELCRVAGVPVPSNALEGHELIVRLLEATPAEVKTDDGIPF